MVGGGGVGAILAQCVLTWLTLELAIFSTTAPAWEMRTPPEILLLREPGGASPLVSSDTSIDLFGVPMASAMWHLRSSPPCETM